MLLRLIQCFTNKPYETRTKLYQDFMKNNSRIMVKDGIRIQLYKKIMKIEKLNIPIRGLMTLKQKFTVLGVTYD